MIPAEGLNSDQSKDNKSSTRVDLPTPEVNEENLRSILQEVIDANKYRRLIEQVIGEDDAQFVPTSTGVQSLQGEHNIVRNKLRAELRATLQAVIDDNQFIDGMTEYMAPDALDGAVGKIQAILAATAEEAYRQGYIDGGIDQLTKELQQ